MLDILYTIVFSVAAGCLIGLLPGLPIWLGIFIIFPFIDSLSALQIITFWLGIAIGSQFFGSVSTLLLRMPGENSSLIYLKDTFQLSIQQRLDLVRQTAWGSAVATLVGLCVVAVLYYLGSDQSIIAWTSSLVKFIVYSLLFVLLIWSSNGKIWALILLLLGVLLADKTNSALPVWMLQLNYEISHLTIFSATLALVIIPEVLSFKKLDFSSERSDLKYSKESIKWKTIFSGSTIGCVSGLIPGMTATIGSISAYKFFKGSTQEKIIAAESANNSAIITALLPLIVLGIPTTVDSIMVSNALNLKLLELPMVFREEVFLSISLGWMTLILGTIFSLIFFYLSQRFLKFYIKLVELTHTKLLFLYVGIIAFLIYFDISTNAVNISAYFLMLSALTAFGFWLKKREINPLPFLLGLLLGDSITWSYYHVATIYL